MSFDRPSSLFREIKWSSSSCHSLIMLRFTCDTPTLSSIAILRDHRHKYSDCRGIMDRLRLRLWSTDFGPVSHLGRESFRQEWTISYVFEKPPTPGLPAHPVLVVRRDEGIFFPTKRERCGGGLLLIAG